MKKTYIAPQLEDLGFTADSPLLTVSNVSATLGEDNFDIIGGDASDGDESDSRVFFLWDVE